MSIVDIKCDNSITFSSKSNYGCINENIYIGRGNKGLYWSYLKFNLCKIPNSIDIVSAKLIFFKIPNNKIISEKEKNGSYRVAPVLDYVSKYNYVYNNTIPFNKKYIVTFQDYKNLSYIEIDISKIVVAWINGACENKGIIIYPSNKSKLLLLGGVNPEEKDLTPFLRISYKNKCVPSHKPNECVIKLPIQVKINRA